MKRFLLAVAKGFLVTCALALLIYVEFKLLDFFEYIFGSNGVWIFIALSTFTIFTCAAYYTNENKQH